MDTFSLLKEKKRWVGYTIRPQLQLLQGKRVILLGTGNIARRIAKILVGFDAEVIFFVRSAPDAALHSTQELLEKISWADIIIGCLPGTPETTGLFSNEMIGRMKSTAVFCNIGRGNLIQDETVLVEALKRYRIGGAVLDVTAIEPVPPESELWNCPNTILSQHSGGGQVTEYDGIVATFLENLQNFKTGVPLKNQVNLKAGY